MPRAGNCSIDLTSEPEATDAAPARTRLRSDMTLTSLRLMASGLTLTMAASIGVASAQTPDPAVARANQAAELNLIKQNQQTSQDTTRRIQLDPSGKAPYALAQPVVTLQATKDSSQAVAVIGFSNP